MFKRFLLIRPDQDVLQIEVPKNLKGKLVEIIIQEKAPDPDVVLDEKDEQIMAQKEEELKILDKLRNQLNVWDH